MLQHLLVQGACRAALQLLLSHLSRFVSILLIIFQQTGLFIKGSGLRIGSFRVCSRVIRNAVLVRRCALSLSGDGLLIKLIVYFPTRLLQSYHILFILNPYQSLFEAFAVLVQLLLPFVV